MSAPSVEGTITHHDGSTSRFWLTPDGSGQDVFGCTGDYHATPADSVDLVSGMMGAFAEYVEEAGA